MLFRSLRYHPYDRHGHRVVRNKIHNNIVAHNGGSQIFITPDPKDKPGYVKNNVSDYNLFFAIQDGQEAVGRWDKTQINGTYSTEEWFKIYGFDEHSFQANPRFVSPGMFDFRLQVDSPAIGQGLPLDDVTDDFFGRKRPSGRAPSLGAVEYLPDDIFQIMQHTLK